MRFDAFAADEKELAQKKGHLRSILYDQYSIEVGWGG